ncbi:MAG TPA: hypothetical protein DCF78_04260 [Dehalococcoidia bacterium]|nr:hypothetical protein [Dehalococcoidia bacterium]
MANQLRRKWILGALALIVLGLIAACGQSNSTIVKPPAPTTEAVPTPTSEPVMAPQPQSTALPQPTLTPPTPVPTENTSTPIEAPTASAKSTPVPVPDTSTPVLEPEPVPRPASPSLKTPTPAPTATPFVYALPPVDRDLFNLALRLRPEKDIPNSRIIATSAVPLEVGHQDSFLLTNLTDGKSRSINATVQVVSEHANWYVDNDVNIPAQDLKKAARIYEDQVRPAVVSALGDIWNPGIDGDPRLNILHANLSGAAGYYGSRDEFPRQVHPNSNEREIIYMDARSLKAGSDLYMGVLAHELQHAIHWNQDIGEEAWVNEGLSEYATNLAGYRAQSQDSFLKRPQVQLNSWPTDIQTSFPHYGASVLFFTYLSQHYGGPEGMGELVRQQLDGVAGVNAYLAQYETTFTEVFQNWVVANYLDASTGPYGYPDTDVELQNAAKVSRAASLRERQPQFSAQYYDLSALGGHVTLLFQGATTTRLVGNGCHDGKSCWWGGMADSIDSTLTGRFDLSGLNKASLKFDIWYDIERGWDYAYVEVSKDDGQTWDILRMSRSTKYNPTGNSYGHGYTGSSGVWVDEFVDLTPYVGGEVLIRFEYVTDDAAHLDGVVIDNIAIPELGFLDDVESYTVWEAQGFTRIGEFLPQQYAVQLMEIFEDDTFRVTPMELDANNAGGLVITGIGSVVKKAALVVSPITEGTRHPTNFDLEIILPGPTGP